mmetsp:Transcript_58376/g.133956  ORF Transcript_58376/g.133956 Transcript_58376/m.133956 type:complete len:410 (+) Transcript_58376:422-1651(+)
MPALRRDLVDHRLLQRRELRAPLIDGGILLHVLRLVGEQQQLLHLVNVRVHLPVEDERDEQRLHLCVGDVELARDEGDADARVRLDHLEQHLRSDVLEQVLNVHLDVGVAHNRARVLLEDPLELSDLVAHVRRDQIGHRHNLGVVLVRLRLLRIERVDVRIHEHVGEDEVLEALHSPCDTRLVVILERLKKVVPRLFPLALRHVHLATTLSDHAHDLGMRYGGLDLQRLLVEQLQLLVVLGGGVHLDLERIHLEQLRALPQVIRTVLALARLVELLDDSLQPAVLGPVEPQLAQLEVGLEPQPLILSFLQSRERRLVQLLQKVHLVGARDKVEHLVDHLLRVVTRDRRLDESQHLPVGSHHLLVMAALELQLDHLLVRLEPPLPLGVLHSHHLVEAGEGGIHVRFDEAL